MRGTAGSVGDEAHRFVHALRGRPATGGRATLDGIVVTEELDLEQLLERELTAGLDLLASLSVTDRIHVRAAVNKLSSAIDEVRTEHKAIEATDPESHLGPLMADLVAELQNRRLLLLFEVVFGEFFVLEDPQPDRDGKLPDGNIYRDGEAMAHDTLF